MDKLVELIRTNASQISALAAVCALFVSFMSILLTSISLWLQRRHYFKSLTPIPNFLIGDYEQEIFVKVRNTGVGPLIVESFRASDGNKTRDDIIGLMPDAPPGIYWNTFTETIDRWCIAPNHEIFLIKLYGNPDDERFAAFRDEVRRALSRITVTLKFKDVYDRRMPTKQRELRWFARHFDDPSAPESSGEEVIAPARSRAHRSSSPPVP